MIFYLECSVHDLAAADRGELEDLFSGLVDADRFGRHFFVAQREHCTWAMENLELSGQSRAHLDSIREKYPERYSLIKNEYAHVNVILGADCVSVDGAATFSVGHKKLLEGEYLQSKTSLVTEDVERDAKLYGGILREVRRFCSGPSFCFEPVHGGGARTSAVFDLEVRKNRVVVCIVDHDKSAPTDRQSSTARAVMENYRRRNMDAWPNNVCFIGIALVTVGRELENFIPYSVLKCIPRYRDYRDFDVLDQIMRQDRDVERSDMFWLYFDIKEGMCGTKLQEKVLEGALSNVAVDWICGKVRCERQNLSEVEISGFGQNVVEAVLENYEALGKFHTCVRGEYWRNVYGEYFEKILWYLAAPSRERT